MPVFVNLRPIVHQGSGHVSVAMPDVCKTPAPPAPPIPVPYPNVGMSSQAVAGPITVTTESLMPVVKGTQYALSSGDEAGSLGGVVSNMIMGPCEFLLYSFDVKIEGKGACRLGDPMFHNKKNGIG